MSKRQALTIFSVLTALEKDLRWLCLTALSMNSFPLNNDERRDAERRYLSHKGVSAAKLPWSDLVDYLDLSQTLDLLDRHRVTICRGLGASENDLKLLVKRIRPLASIRNTVCHARPLENGDLALTLETSRDLTITSALIELSSLSQALRQLDADSFDPASVVIPSFWQTDGKAIENNLPRPEYLSTGFIGRQADRNALLKHIAGAHNVINITGEGGVGKTALVLNCLYDLIERAPPFDVVVWTTLKTTRLTTAGMKTVLGAMTTDIELLSCFSHQFGSNLNDPTREDLIQSVHQILAEFRVLLVIDNLETIDVDALRPLFVDLPTGSKILLTSRVAMGEFELRYKLQPMDDRDAVQLLRATGRLLNQGSLLSHSDDKLRTICSRLFFNPLAIRWFVQSYSEGITTPALLDRQRNFQEVLKFCFQSIYDSLSEEYKNYLRTLVALGPLSEVQLALLSNVDDIDHIREALGFLYSSNLLLRSKDEWVGTSAELWGITEFAKNFLLAYDRQITSTRPKLQRRFQDLIRARDENRQFASLNPFREFAIDTRSSSEAAVVQNLHDAIKASRRNNHSNALRIIERTKALAPDFFEVWRVSARVKQRANDAFGAQEDFREALTLAGGQSEPLLVYYAQYLRSQGETDRAITILTERVAAPDPTPQLIGELAHTLAVNGSYRDALIHFANARKGISSLSAGERVFLLTRYADCLRLAAENELGRNLPDEATRHMIIAFEVIEQACESGTWDQKILFVGQSCVETSCKVMASRCSRTTWKTFEGYLRKLSGFFDLLGHRHDQVDRLRAKCAEIGQRPDFLQLLPMPGPGLKRGSVFGVIERVAEQQGFAFARGDDGLEYVVHSSEIPESMEWTEFCALRQPRVRFMVKAPLRQGGGLRACAVEVFRPASDNASEEELR